MSFPRISVIVPTVPGREDHLARCTDAYTRLAAGNYDLELIVEHDHRSCGLGWQAGAQYASGDFIHLTDDDIEPWPGWHVPAIEVVERGCIPAPQVYSPAGYPQSHPQPGFVGSDWTVVHMSALPFCSRQQWEEIQPLFTAHYFTDDFFSVRAQRAGWTVRLRTGYAFTHHWAQVRRGAGMPEPDRMRNDEALYREALRRVESGEWTEPWPADGGCP